MAGLNKELCNKFINENYKFKNELENLFENTIYFTTQEVIDGLRKLVKNYFSNFEGKLYVYATETGSEGYFYDMCKDLFPPYKILMEAPEEEATILFLDDWILSGNNMANNFENIFYQKNKYNYEIVFISFINTRNGIFTIEGLQNYYKNVKFNFVYEHLLELFEVSDEFAKYFNPDTEASSFPVHFEYKIANQFGSYPEIYKKCRYEINKPYKS